MKKFKNSRLSTDSRKLQTLALKDLNPTLPLAYLQLAKLGIKHFWGKGVERSKKGTLTVAPDR